MKLSFNNQLASSYKSTSQKVRVLTEDWVDKSIFCPNCGQTSIDKYPNNQPVADFHCVNCREEYELKSKQGAVGVKIVDGAYRTMIERLSGANNPNFFVLNYDLVSYEVTTFLVIPKHFFTPEIIEKRKALSSKAQRAGWIGCSILLNKIPQSGKVFFIRNKQIEPKEKVLAEWKKTIFLREEKSVVTRGWLLDVMKSIESLNKREFTLDEAYRFEKALKVQHPRNKHVKDKIRQQLQVLRDKDYIEFIGRGTYRLT